MDNSQIFFELPRISAALLHKPWMILPSIHRSLIDQVSSFIESRSHPAAAGKNAIFEETPLPPGAINRLTTYDKASGLAVINARGVIGKGLSTLAMNCGGLCVDQIEQSLEQLRSKNPKAVAIHINSPGGTVNGTEECGHALRAFSAEVAPVHAFTDTMCASAAYWLAASCDTLHVAPSAYVGSIGVYSYLVDDSAAWAAEGRRMILVASGPQKAAGFPGTVVTDEQVAELRATVGRMAKRFESYVMSRRPGIDANSAFSGAAWAAQDAPAGVHDGYLRSRSDHLAFVLASAGRYKRAA